MKLGDIEYVYSRRKDGVHRQGVRLMTNKKTTKSCLGCKGIKKKKTESLKYGVSLHEIPI